MPKRSLGGLLARLGERLCLSRGQRDQQLVLWIIAVVPVDGLAENQRVVLTARRASLYRTEEVGLIDDSRDEPETARPFPRDGRVGVGALLTTSSCIDSSRIMRVGRDAGRELPARADAYGWVRF